jgi:hypothetical protein
MVADHSINLNGRDSLLKTKERISAGMILVFVIVERPKMYFSRAVVLKKG